MDLYKCRFTLNNHINSQNQNNSCDIFFSTLCDTSDNLVTASAVRGVNSSSEFMVKSLPANKLKQMHGTLDLDKLTDTISAFYNVHILDLRFCVVRN